MFEKVLIANRGAIACRIIRTLRALGARSVVVFTEADRASKHVDEADEAVWLGEGPPADSYLNGAKLIEVARACGAQAIHPGYGFLSENAAFAEACAAAGIVFIGPTPVQLREFGLKHTARARAQAAGVPLLPGTSLLADVESARREASVIGYPVMLKSTAGGGGIGMRLCHDDAELNDAFAAVRRLSEKSFADGGLYLERYVANARHLEVQIFGDGHGEVIALGERDCSLQRRNQKVVEEAPAPNLSATTRESLWRHAVNLGRAVSYRSAGTVEYVYDAARDEFYFLEVNTRLQVEHGVTEEVMGVDLVAWMIQLAAGDMPPLVSIAPRAHGHSIQVRVYAEDPSKQFQPSPGDIHYVRWPDAARIETWVSAGCNVSTFYDPMLAKIIVAGADRAHALRLLEHALATCQVDGVATNLSYLREAIALPDFVAGTHVTQTLSKFEFAPFTVDVLAPGTETTLQDYPGRVGYWSVGVPPSGPMDDYSFRLGNRLLGNAESAAGLEMIVSGPTLRFNQPATICLAGASMQATLDGGTVPWWQPITVAKGATLALGNMHGDGARAYLLVRGGFAVSPTLGSASTFTLGRFGGVNGRALRVGDALPLTRDDLAALPPSNPSCATPLGERRLLRVIYGPHGAPDFFTPGDIEEFFAASWEVHYQSSRTGVRLIGPAPQWARTDGGEAGLHPSNLHDNAYAIGAIDFTGDMPVILGPDGPSLGGFVCPATVIAADRWKIGQLRPGDRIQFVPVDEDTANRLERAQRQAIATLQPIAAYWHPSRALSAIRHVLPTPRHSVGVTYRPAGDRYLLIEYGPQVLDINLRFRVHSLMNLLAARAHPGILELTPGIRSLQVHYEPQGIPLPALLRELESLEHEIDAQPLQPVQSRCVHLPLAWDDPSTRLAIAKYTQGVRADAPWCPSNIEFIRRVNGLASVDEVYDTVFAATYLVMGLGDVYLGAPVATPLDPRHRLVTTKYNPARTWTPENAVGIGGSYLCIYGMEGPGGYQFVGRTLQMWNRFRTTPEFSKPWLLRFFDRIKFFPVSADELTTIRRDFPLGRYRLKIEDGEFDLATYNEFLAANSSGISAFKSRQQAAFDAERQRWQDAGLMTNVSLSLDPPPQPDEFVLKAHEHAVASHVHGSVWQVTAQVGHMVNAGDTLAIVEAMKMEIAIVAERAGRVTQVCCQPGGQVRPGQPLLIMEGLR